MEVVNLLGGMKGKMNFEETELRHGLSGNISKLNSNIPVNSGATNANGKRGFVEPANVDWKLNLVSSKADGEIVDQAAESEEIKNLLGGAGSTDSVVLKPPSKAQIVGWPPVRSYKKNIISPEKVASKKGDEENEKVMSLDGAPKVDLKMYKSYQELSDALGNNMFNSFTIGNFGSQGMMDLLNNSDYFPTYDDKDGELVTGCSWAMSLRRCLWLLASACA